MVPGQNKILIVSQAIDLSFGPTKTTTTFFPFTDQKPQLHAGDYVSEAVDL